MSQKKGILITGGFGFIGSNLARHYLRQGIPVLCVDNLSTAFRPNKETLEQEFPHLLQSVIVDVEKPWQEWTAKFSEEFLSSFTHLYFLSSPASPKDFQTKALEILKANSLGLMNALEFCTTYKTRLIFASTSEIYGSVGKELLSENLWGNVSTRGERSAYDEAKRFGEAYLYSYNQITGGHHGLVRIFNTYGPGMHPKDGRVVVNFLTQAMMQNELHINGDGQQTRSFCYIDDLLRALVAYAESDLTDPVNLGNDDEISVLELANTVQKLFPEKNLQFHFKSALADEPRYRRPDLQLAKKLLAPWQPNISLQTGLENTKQWLEKNLL